MSYLSKHRVMFSTICLSLTVSILASQSLTCLASNPTKQDDLKEDKRESALVRWPLIVVDEKLYTPINFAVGRQAYADNTKLLQTYNNEQIAQQIAEREAGTRQLSLVEALQAYRAETARNAWNGNKGLQEMLGSLMTQHKGLKNILPALVLQYTAMRMHIEETERVQEDEKTRALARLRQESEDNASKSRRIAELERERSEKKTATIADKEKEAEAKRAAEAATLENQRHLEEKDAEIRRLAEQMRVINEQKLAADARILQLEQQPVPVAHNGLADGEVLGLRAALQFYKERCSWWSSILDYCFGRKPDVEKVRLTNNEV